MLFLEEKYVLLIANVGIFLIEYFRGVFFSAKRWYFGMWLLADMRYISVFQELPSAKKNEMHSGELIQ